MKYMEDHLDMPLAEVLEHVQQRIMEQTSYFGIKTLKSPMDCWVYQEIITSMRPDVIIEIGNYCGGSTLALAHMCDALGSGRVIGLDISHATVDPQARNHHRITFIEGAACDSFDKVKELVGADERVLVIEDSAHTFDNTLAVLRMYSAFVKPGDYFIVEDSICHHGLDVGPQPGPYEAIEAFVAENGEFTIDRDMESFLITWNPKGYLKRIGS